MGIEWIIMAVIAAVGVAVSATVGGVQAAQNKKAIEDTNQTNLEIARETNQSNVEQAELAYQRSLPANQVKSLMDAGMSRAGAINKLTGGGTYQAPTLQSAHLDAPQMDLSQVASSMERLQNIPSSAEQYRLVSEQRKALETDTQIKLNQDLRNQEKHQMEMWTSLHGKQATEMIDNLSSQIVSDAADKGISLDGIDSIDKLVNAFDLGNNKIWRTMPKSARDEVLSGVRLQAAENRAQQTQQNQNQAAQDAHTAAKDAHTAALDALKNSEAERVLKHHQVNKLIADTEQSWQHVQEFDDATDARQKENAARAARADYEKIMSNFGLSKSDIYNSNFYYMDKDGNIHLTEKAKVKKGFEEAWKFAGSFFGVDLLKDIVSGLVAISPK